MNKVGETKTLNVSKTLTFVGYYHILALLFCFIFILSNIAASKVSIFGGIFIDAGTAYFPLLYIINDVITEIYGFRASRKVIWLAVCSNICFVLFLSLIVKLPSSYSEGSNESFDLLFSFSPRILVASVTSFLIGEYFNSMILAKSKIKFQGKMFMLRAIFSTLIGVSIESGLFSVIAFTGVVPSGELLSMTLLLIFAKVFYEAITIPITLRFVMFLKKKENYDYYDKDTKFNLFSF